MARKSNDTCDCGFWMLKTACPLCEQHIKSPNVVSVGDWTTIHGRRYEVIEVRAHDVIVRHGILKLEIPVSYTDAAEQLRGRKSPAVV